MATKAYVGNISFEAQKQDLQALFQEFGEVVSVNLITDQFTGKLKGFGFVEMSTAAECESAIEGLNGKMFAGRTLTVNLAKEKSASDRPKFSNNRPSGGFGSKNRSNNRY